ncbi:MAG: molybdate ABC transporter substrate-binding protein [Methyloglobulus sp.]|nr:molybdate ABC transporter substrate-binding protein [Methyloglobulus sp.]
MQSKRLLILCLLLAFCLTSQAATVLVAVASNFTKPMTEIAEAFEKATGHSANLAFGSSGKFVAQLENGGPFEVFLSADTSNPVKLEKSGLAVDGSRFTYAIGKLVLWSSQVNYVDAQGQVLSTGSFKHLALADPKLAPYGAAAMEVMKNLNVQDKLQLLFVLGENIAQTYQFISTGNAELGFIALSQVIGKDGKITEGSGWIVPSNLHNPILQDAILLKKGAENPAAPALLKFLKSPEAQAIISKYGYDIAGQP